MEALTESEAETLANLSQDDCNRFLGWMLATGKMTPTAGVADACREFLMMRDRLAGRGEAPRHEGDRRETVKTLEEVSA